MRKYTLLLSFSFYCLTAFAQSASYLTEEDSEHTYPVIVPYQNEQQALSFSYSQSPFYMDVTGQFQEKNSEVHKEISSQSSSTSPRYTTLYARLKLPDHWQQRETIIALAPQLVSGMLLVNGKAVASIEKELPLQFNITPLLQAKDILIELKLHGKWQPNSLYPVMLISAPPLHIINFDVGQWYSPMPQKDISWGENFEAKNYAPHHFNISYGTLSKFYDQSLHLYKQIKPDWDFTNIVSGKRQHFGTGFSTGNFRNWNSESPHLYLYTQQIHTSDKSLEEVVSRKVGFRVVSMQNNTLSLGNMPLSKPISLKPVKYLLPSTYDSLYSKDLLYRELITLKKHNINTIILSGYPSASPVYDICDELGLYVIQTIDLPTLESLQQTSLDEKAEVWHKQQAKVLAGLRQLKTHPSVISLIFRNEYTSVLNASALTDAISHYNRDMIIAFKNRLLSQGNTYHQAFPIDWYRTPVWQQLDNPHRDSLQKAYQYVDFWVKESSTNKLYITNQYDFSNLNEMYLKWQILENGHTVAHGLIDDLNVLPKKSLETSLPFNYKSYLNKKSCVFRFSLHLKEPALWAEKNQQIAWEEFRFTSADARGVLIKKQDKK